MSDVDVVQKLKSREGTRVHYKYPNGEGDQGGVLTHREVFKGGMSGGRVQYWHVVDTIKFDDVLRYRLGYYRQMENGRLNWGSQTTATYAAQQLSPQLAYLQQKIAQEAA